MKLLVDSDFIVYRISCALDNTRHRFRGSVYESKTEIKKLFGTEYAPEAVETFREPEPIETLHKQLDRTVEDIVDGSWCSSYQLYLSGKSNFRYKVKNALLPYKANRSGGERPFHYDNSRQYLAEKYGAEFSVNMEADDILGLNQTEDTMIGSLDKDLLVVPGKHYNWIKDEEVTVSTLEADRYFFSQLITGDTADNILGLFGQGPKGAMVKKVQKMKDAKEMDDLVRGEYGRRFGSHGD